MSPPRTWSPETKIGIPLTVIGGLLLSVLWVVLDLRDRVSKIEGYIQAKAETASTPSAGPVANK